MNNIVFVFRWNYLNRYSEIMFEKGTNDVFLFGFEIGADMYFYRIDGLSSNLILLINE